MSDQDYDGYMEEEEEWDREGLLDPAWEKQQKKVGCFLYMFDDSDTILCTHKKSWSRNPLLFPVYNLCNMIHLNVMRKFTPVWRSCFLKFIKSAAMTVDAKFGSVVNGAELSTMYFDDNETFKCVTSYLIALD